MCSAKWPHLSWKPIDGTESAAHMLLRCMLSIQARWTRRPSPHLDRPEAWVNRVLRACVCKKGAMGRVPSILRVDALLIDKASNKARYTSCCGRNGSLGQPDRAQCLDTEPISRGMTQSPRVAMRGVGLSRSRATSPPSRSSLQNYMATF